jgi:hypothetical protein
MGERRSGEDRRDRRPLDPHELVNDFQFVILNAPRRVMVSLAYIVKAHREMIEFVRRHHRSDEPND